MNEFHTKRLQISIFLHAGGLLQFLRCEPNADGRLRFVFSDPRRVGSQLELDYEHGATVSAKDLFASQTFLRRQMSDALENRRTGESENDRTHR